MDHWHFQRRPWLTRNSDTVFIVASQLLSLKLNESKIHDSYVMQN